MDVPIDPAITHAHLLSIMRVLPTDYSDHGGTVERWADDDKAYPDCSCGCKWAAWLAGELGFDWCVCTNVNSPRLGLLTFEHQTGEGCFEERDEPDDDHDDIQNLGAIDL